MKRKIGLICLTAGLVSCFSGNSETDSLRSSVSDQGISLGLQVDLPSSSLKAQVVASIYEDGERQPLVGGDIFLASSSVDEERLESLDNLDGDYRGTVRLDSENDAVTVETDYEPGIAREDRWYPADELSYDPGPNEALIGYGEEFEFPARLSNVTIGATNYSSRLDDINISWDAGDGDQITLNAIVTCEDGDDDFSYPLFLVLSNEDTGSHTLKVGELIPNELIVNAVATLSDEVTTILAAYYLDLYTQGLIEAEDIPLDTFNMDYCDVNLTLFREKGVALPDDVEGGFAIASTSHVIGDEYSFRYTPGAP